MPPIIRVEEISKYTGQEVTVQGWVYNRTDKGKLVFLLVRDGSGFVQCVAFKGDLTRSRFRPAHPPAAGILGHHHGPGARRQARAWHPGRIRSRRQGDRRSCRRPAIDYPMALKEHGVDFALDNRHLWIRMPSQWAILRVRATVMAAIREWFELTASSTWIRPS